MYIHIFTRMLSIVATNRDTGLLRCGPDCVINLTVPVCVVCPFFPELAPLLRQPAFSARELVPACVIAVALLLAFALLMRLRSRWSVHLLSHVAAAFLVASVTSLVLVGFTMNDVEPPDVPVMNGTRIVFVAGPATYSDDHSGEFFGMFSFI